MIIIMILVLSGTKDGRELAEKIKNLYNETIVSVTTSFGASLISGNVHIGRLDANGMINFVKDNNIRIIVDATHPFAKEASENAIKAAAELGLHYIRYERKSFKTAYSGIILVSTHSEAIDKINAMTGNVFLTIGSKQLHEYIKGINEISRMTVRVMPDGAIIDMCTKMGLMPSQILAMSGEFSEMLNCATFREYNAKVVVTKDSGSVGGADSKITACKSLQIPIIIINRPKINYPFVESDFGSILEMINKWAN